MADVPVYYPSTTTFTQGNSFFDDANPENKRSLLPLQQAIGEPASAHMGSGTGLLLPDVHTLDRLAHFPDDLYDLSSDSHLVRFLRSLLGPSGGGQLRSRQAIARIQTQAPNFYDLDGFYGAIFNSVRTMPERIPINGFTDVATQDEWETYLNSDALYRERIFRLARGINMGGTVPGIQAAAEAITGVECEVYEIWPIKDAQDPLYGVPPTPPPPPPPGGGFVGTRTWGAVEVTFFTWDSVEAAPDWGSIEDGSYSPLGMALGGGDEVLGLSSGDEVLGLVQRTWFDVEDDFGIWGTAEVFGGNPLTWDDVEFVTTSSSGTGPTLNATPDGLNVDITWTAYPGAVGYVLRDNGTTIYVNGPATGATLTTSYTHAGAVGTNTYQVTPYTAYSGGVATYGFPSNSVTVTMTSSIGLDAPENSRSFFLICPKKVYDTPEDRVNDQYAILKVVDVLRPAGTRGEVDENGLALLEELVINNLDCANNYWQVIAKVSPRRTLTHDPTKVYPLSQGQSDAGYGPYDTRETPLPAMVTPQGTEISYNSEVVAVSAYALDADGNVINSTDFESVPYPDGNTVSYTAEKAVLDARHALSSRYANDGVIVSAPYSDTRVPVVTHG
jgi:hypothetical protein